MRDKRTESPLKNGSEEVLMNRLLVALALVLACWGCKEDTRTIKVTYDQVADLRAGNPVLFEGRPIGRVTDIYYSTQNKYVLDLAIDMAFANAVTKSSVFYITDNPEVDAEMAIEVVNREPGAQPLEEGAVVAGSQRPSRDFGEIGDDIQQGIQDLKKSVEGFFDGLGDVSESEEFKRLQEELSELGKAMKQSGKSMHDKVQKEILPRIRREIEELRKKLEEMGREEEVRPLEKQVEEMMEREV